MGPRWPSGRASAWGSAYVLLGSTLGGQRLARDVASSDPAGLRLEFLVGHGSDTGPRWKRFVAALDDSGADPELAIEAASETFAFFTRRL